MNSSDIHRPQPHRGRREIDGVCQVSSRTRISQTAGGANAL